MPLSQGRFLNLSGRLDRFGATRWCDALFLGFIALKFLTFWVGMVVQNPDEPLSVTAMYRYIEPGYHTIINSLRHPTLGETTVLESYGQGIRSFPLPSIVPHAVLIGIFGSAGYVVCDVLAAIAYYLLVRGLGFMFCKSSMVVKTVALALTLKIDRVFELLTGNEFPVFWGISAPRPFVTELYFVACLWLLSILLVREGAHRKMMNWVLLALASVCLAQCQSYLAFPIAFAIVVSSLYLLATKPGDRSVLVRNGLVSGIVGIWAFAPFIVQRLVENPDMPQRYGLMPMALEKMPSPWAFYAQSQDLPANAIFILGLFGIVVSIFAFGWKRFAGLYIASATMLLVTYFGPWMMVAATGEALLLYLFEDAMARSVSYGLLVMVLIVAGGMVKGQSLVIRNALVAGLLALVLVRNGKNVHTHFTETRSGHTAVYDAFHETLGDGYRKDFGEVANFIQEQSTDDDLVLGTFDVQMLGWWTAAMKRQVYCADSTTSIIPNRELEARVIECCHLLGMSEEQFVEFIHVDYHIAYFLAYFRYQAGQAYMPFPIEDYREEDQRYMANNPRRFGDPFCFLMPLSEERRLATKFRLAAGAPLSHRLDLVLTNKAVPRAPDANRYGLIFQNDSFKLYRKINSGEATALARSQPKGQLTEGRR